MENSKEMIKHSGFLFDRVYNYFGLEVMPKNTNPKDLAAKWGNQTTPTGEIIEFKTPLSESDFYFHSFCGSWYEAKHKYGNDIGFRDDVWLNAEEWALDEAFTNKKEDFRRSVGLASLAIDIKNKVAYTVPAMGQSGYEKLMPINPKHKDYVVIVAAGYNNNQVGAPIRVYVGMKDRLADGSQIDYSTSNERDIFLARNGLLYGKLYGVAIPNKTYHAIKGDNKPIEPDFLIGDEWLKKENTPSKISGRFYPTSFKWQGFDSPVAVSETEIGLWSQPSEQPKGYSFLNIHPKNEHPAADPDANNSRFIQNMTKRGALLGFDFKHIEKQLTMAGGDLPEFLDTEITRIVPAVDGSLHLKTGGQGTVYGGKSASIHVEKNRASMVEPDGLIWIKAKDGNYVIVDEDSGNDFGERKYILPLNDDMTLKTLKTGYLLALAGGKHSARYKNKVSALGGAFTKPGSLSFLEAGILPPY